MAPYDHEKLRRALEEVLESQTTDGPQVLILFRSAERMSKSHPGSRTVVTSLLSPVDGGFHVFKAKGEGWYWGEWTEKGGPTKRVFAKEDILTSMSKLTGMGRRSWEDDRAGFLTVDRFCIEPFVELDDGMRHFLGPNPESTVLELALWAIDKTLNAQLEYL